MVFLSFCVFALEWVLNNRTNLKTGCDCSFEVEPKAVCWGMSSVVKTYGASWVLMLILVPQISDSKKWIRCQLSVLGLPLFIKLLVYSFYYKSWYYFRYYFSIITPVFSVTWSFRNQSILIWYKKKNNAQMFFFCCCFFCFFGN